MAAQKENHTPEWPKSGVRSQANLNTDLNQIPIKTNKRSDHILIKQINGQSLIPKLY